MTYDIDFDDMPSIKSDFAGAVLEGNEGELGLGLEFQQYVNMIELRLTVAQAYIHFKQACPKASVGCNNDNFDRFCVDLELLVDAEIIEDLTFVKNRFGDPVEGRYAREQPFVATEHGQSVISEYKSQQPM